MTGRRGGTGSQPLQHHGNTQLPEQDFTAQKETTRPYTLLQLPPLKVF